MARPPFARRAPHTAGEPPAGQRDLDVLPHAYADFLAMERDLASTELGFPVFDDTSARGDLAGTVMEMSALVAHVLGLYNDRYGNEGFLGTATSPASLVRHGRRLAYEPSPGVTASGYIALFAKDGLAGTIPSRFAFTSAAVGEKPAQDYELVADADVDASVNALFPADSLEAITGGTPATITLSQLVVSGVDLDLAPGAIVVVSWDEPGGLRGVARTVTSIGVDEEDEETTVVLGAAVVVPYGATEVVLLARPDLEVHAFGFDAPAVFDGVVAFDPPSVPAIEHVLLAREVDDPLGHEPVVHVVGGAATSLRVVATSTGFEQETTTVRIHREVMAAYNTFADPPANTVPITVPAVVLYHTGSVTRLVLETTDGAATVFNRPAVVDRASRYLSRWQLRVPVRTWRPSTVPLSPTLVLDGEHPWFVPGRLFAIEAINDDAGAESIVARVRLATIASGQTTVELSLVDPSATLAGFRLGHLRVLGNVAPITHGKTVVETLGDSDGVSAFQRLRLAKTPVAHGIGALGSEPHLEARVGGVLFRRVVDLELSQPGDPVFVTERDEAGVVSIVFGDGVKGAIPPSGKRHVQAVYRKGIGPVGNAPAGAVAKITKGHPVLDGAYNPVPVAGGVDPASADEVREQAPLYLATFDRAVSVPDHAKLALRCPGVVRAHAYLGDVKPGVEGVIVVIADRDGLAPNAPDVKKFLRERRDNTLPFDVVPPGVVDVAIELGIVFDPAFDEEKVKLDLRALLTSDRDDAPGLLTFGARDLGQPLFASQIVEWVERLPGIVAFRLVALSVVSGAVNPPSVPPATLDTVRADAGEWIRLQPSHLTLTKLAEAV